MKKFLFTLVTLLAMQFILAAPLKVVTSFSILGDVTQQIAGDKATVKNLIGVNQDAHHYKLTTENLKALEAADIIFVQGLHFETMEIEKVLQPYQAKVIVLGEQLNPADLIELTEHDHHHGHDHDHDHDETAEFDPHTWHNPLLVQQNAKNIRDALIKKDPANKAYYSKQFNQYYAQLKQLDEWIQKGINKIPMQQRVLLTIHPAFNYLGKRYQFRQILSIETGNEHGEISAKHVAEIIKTIKAEKIKVIFTENAKNLKIANSIAKASGAKIVGELYADSLSAPNGKAPNYLKLMTHNVTTIVNALTK